MKICPKTTRWFDGNEKPGRYGVYRRKNPDTGLEYWSKWSVRRQKWLMFCHHWEAANEVVKVSGYQHWPWQGLTSRMKHENNTMV